MRFTCGLALILFSLGTVSAVRAEETLGRIPLKANEFDALVKKYAAQTGGNEAAMAKKLRSGGFSCNPANAPFECVKFGCQRGTFGAGALLQWTVDRSSTANGKTVFTGSTINYRWHQSCISPGGIEEAQEAFLARNGRKK